jgi:DNA-binding transcriptional regulator/RsmH inhibitor MraZ
LNERRVCGHGEVSLKPMTSLFHGSAICDVDAEGNVTVPEFLADALAADTADLVVAKHDAEACLVGYGRERLTTLQDRAERRRQAEEDRGEDARKHYHRMRRTFGLADRMPHGDNVIRISAAMRHLGKIDRLALFVGAGDSFEIWNPDLALQSDDAMFRELAAFRLRMRRDTNTKGVQ